MSEVRIDHAVSTGTFNLDGQTFDVENNIWVVGNDKECMVIDAPHSVDAIMTAVGDRFVSAILCTHGHDDHINAADALSTRTNAPVLLNPADLKLWQQTYPNTKPDNELNNNDMFYIGGTGLRVLHTPGHAPGSICLWVPNLNVVFTGDTLFEGGPGASHFSTGDKPTLLRSIHQRLFTLPDDVVVHTGHGASTTIGAEKARVGVYAEEDS